MNNKTTSEISSYLLFYAYHSFSIGNDQYDYCYSKLCTKLFGTKDAVDMANRHSRNDTDCSDICS